jgi:hypothetical protein
MVPDLLHFSGMLTGKFVRSSFPLQRIKMNRSREIPQFNVIQQSMDLLSQVPSRTGLHTIVNMKNHCSMEQGDVSSDFALFV